MTAQGASVIDLSERRRWRDEMRAQERAGTPAIGTGPLPPVAWVPVWFVPIVMVPGATAE